MVSFRLVSVGFGSDLPVNVGQTFSFGYAHLFGFDCGVVYKSFELTRPASTAKHVFHLPKAVKRNKTITESMYIVRIKYGQYMHTNGQPRNIAIPSVPRVERISEHGRRCTRYRCDKVLFDFCLVCTPRGENS